MRPKPLTALAVVAASLAAGPAAASARPTTTTRPAVAVAVAASAGSQARTIARLRPAVAVAASASSQARTIARLIDRIRVRHGLRALHTNRRLGRAARRHSADMRRRGYFAHDGPDGTPGGRVAAAGYRPAALIGETLAWGTGPLARPRALVRTWMASPPHRATILTPAFREIGVGVARARGQAWATADFGRRR
ncbi:MAG TPA: CAP domain-containing protein [Solirubrobacteraceae bacterium]|nr:CAP domain-containing protein [Solirubrobacteraceae bacterium]